MYQQTQPKETQINGNKIEAAAADSSSTKKSWDQNAPTKIEIKISYQI